MSNFYVGYIECYIPLVENINICLIATNDLNIYGYLKFYEPVFIFVKVKTFKLILLPNYEADIPWRRFQNIVFPIFPI